MRGQDAHRARGDPAGGGGALHSVLRRLGLCGAAPTGANGITFRFTRRRPPKIPVDRPEDPHTSTTTDNNDPIPRHWQRRITDDTTFTSSLNLQWLRDAAATHIADPALRTYLVDTYSEQLRADPTPSSKTLLVASASDIDKWMSGWN